MTASGAQARYVCRAERRREAVRDAGTVNGVDWLEVHPDQVHLDVHFIHPLPGSGPVAVPPPSVLAGLTAEDVTVEGGDRVRDIRVVDVTTAADVLSVVVDAPGDFSTYTLRLADPVTGEAPDGFDPRLSAVAFSFKAGCPTRFDCAPVDTCPVEPLSEPIVDYLAKDYESFRRLMLDKLASAIPGWVETSPADQQVVLVELLAYVADRLSYEQDAVATEAYLGTARRRVSVRRHARMRDYPVHEGCAARAFVHVGVNQVVAIEAGTVFYAGSPDLRGGGVPFRALHGITARPEHGARPDDEPTRGGIAFHTWSDEECCLPRGATGATLSGDPPLSLAPGDLLLVGEIAGVTSGEFPDADPTHRQVVRLTEVRARTDPLDGTPVVDITWAAEDALTFPLCVSAVTVDPTDGTRRLSAIAVARGNVVLAEHGRRVEGVPLARDVDVAGRFRPRLPDGRPAYAVRYDPDADLPAARLLDLDAREALPRVEVTDGDRDYEPAADLLGSAPDAAEFVVEPEDGAGGETRLRFGDGVYGRRPDPDVPLTATYHLGGGTSGNVAAESIDRTAGEDSAVDLVRNPLPAEGGADPEPLEVVRQAAPHVFRRQKRAVTAADYGDVAQRFPGVQRAAGRLRWTGSWYTATVTADRTGGADLDDDFDRELRTFLDTYRMAGVDVEVAEPVPVPLDVALEACATPDRYAADVEREILDVLSARVLPSGRRGVFHPDRFTFGVPVYLSQLYAAAMTVPGVAWVRATRFRRYGGGDAGKLDAGVITVGDLEIAQLRNDPDVPERGTLAVTVLGGR